MNFNEKQSKLIYEFIMNYNTEEEFQKSIQQLYDNEISQLSILYIYALEEILRYGTKGIFNKFLETKGSHTEQEAVDLYDGFITLLNHDIGFKQHKMDQLKNYPETLSAIEMFAFNLISKTDSKKEQMHKEMTDNFEYDSLNPILYSTDSQIRETLENLFFGEFIHQILDLPDMKPIKARQRANGVIANIDKPFVIEQIQKVISDQDISKFKKIIDKRYIEVKMNLLLNKNADAFQEYLKFNTNISANEILDNEKDMTTEELYAKIVEMFNQRKEQDENSMKK